MKQLQKYLIVLFMMISGATLATPALQLDIVSGDTYYDTGDQTVITSSDTFTLFAYGNTADGNGSAADLTQQHFISIAISPVGTTAGTDFGSFVFAGTTYTSADLVFGAPPIESNLSFDPGDLSKHGVYETLYTQVGFFFDPTQTRSDVNVQDNPGTDPAANSGTAIAYYGFNVDASGLLDGFELHFDLYNTDFARKSLTDLDVTDFAPFSHDAGTGCCRKTVPVPSSLSLMRIGLFAIRRFVKK